MVDESRFGSLDLGPKSLQNAAMVAGGLFVLLAILTFTGLLSILPGYPAVILAFILWGVLPGWWLQRALVASRRAGPVEQVVLAFVMSMALAAAPGVLALRFHWSLEAFAMAYALLAAVVSGISLLWPLQQHHEEDQANEEPHGAASGTTLLLILVAIPLLAIATSPWWAGDRIARDADDLVYVGYISSYADSDELDVSAPFLGTSQGTFSRMDVNVWVVMEALVAKTAGVKGFDLHMHYLPGMLTVLAVAAMFALAKGLFGSTRLALLAAALILIHAFLDLAPQEGIGRMLLLRMAQDKMAASFIFVPAGILLGAWYLEKPTPSAYVAVLLAAGAALVVHPLGLMSIVVALSSVAILRVLVERSRESLQSAAYLIGPWVVLGIAFLVWSWLFVDRVVILGPYLRSKFNVTELPGGMVIGNYHLLLHPMVLASMALAVPAWLLARRQIGNQVLLGMVAGVLLIFFVPFVATPIAEATRDEAVWRLHRLIPVALVLAYVLHYGMMKLSTMATDSRVGPLALLLSFAQAPAVAVLLVFAAAFFIQEQYAVADDGAFYNRTSSTELLPWTGGSIFLGGVERAFSADFRPTVSEQGLLEFLAEKAEPESTVLVEPNISVRFFPGVLSDIRQIAFPGVPQVQERRAVKARFFSSELKGAELLAALQRFRVDYVVVASRSPEEEIIQAVGGERLGETERIKLLEADDFFVRVGDPSVIDASEGGEPLWSFSPAAREIIMGHAEVTMPEGLSDSLIQVNVDLIASAVAGSDQSARLVVTLDPIGGVNAEPIHTVIDLFIESGTQAGESLFRVRSPGVSFSSGQAYNVRVWRDGEHANDTYQGDILFSSLEILWFPAGPPLGIPTYHIYGIDTAEAS